MILLLLSLVPPSTVTVHSKLYLLHYSFPHPLSQFCDHGTMAVLSHCPTPIILCSSTPVRQSFCISAALLLAAWNRNEDWTARDNVHSKRLLCLLHLSASDTDKINFCQLLHKSTRLISYSTSACRHCEAVEISARQYRTCTQSSSGFQASAASGPSHERERQRTV